MYILLVLLSIHCANVNSFIFDTNEITVTTSVGEIVGIVEDVPLNSSFSYKVRRFRGIPYAEAPSGKIRFKKPVAKTPFNTRFDATKDGPVCYQYVVPKFLQDNTMSEDCLRLNIFVGHEFRESFRPVMVWIHGGGFIFGNSNSFDASFLSTFGDVIVVTINYRLAQYGFLSTGDSNLPGNLGLWDQHLAIKWVHDNIQAFGGDVNRITIFGESAGSASVVYQTFYPGNKGLFHRAIAESGSISCFWAHTSSETAASTFNDFVNKLGCHKGDRTLNCLRSLPIDILNETVNTQLMENVLPVVDYDFILDEPTKLISGDTNATAALAMFFSVDFIIGINNADGLLNVNQWLHWTNAQDKNNFTMSKDVFKERAVKSYLELYFHTNISQQVLLETVHVYTDWERPDDPIKRLEKLTDLVTDVYFAIQTVKTANLHAKSNKTTYVYEFYPRPLQHDRWIPTILEGPEVANHGDEISYIFGMGFGITSGNTSLISQYNTYRTMMVLWSNFAKTGDVNYPVDVRTLTNTTWPTYGNEQNYLAITRQMDKQSVKSGLRSEAFHLLDVLLPNLISRTSAYY